jgi:hypothetical protein
MTSRAAALSAFAVFAFGSNALVAAKADEAFEPLGRAGVIQRCAASGGHFACGRFQGYVVVGHGGISGSLETFVAAPRDASSAAPDASLGGERVYLRTGAGD